MLKKVTVVFIFLFSFVGMYASSYTLTRADNSMLTKLYKTIDTIVDNDIDKARLIQKKISLVSVRYSSDTNTRVYTLLNALNEYMSKKIEEHNENKIFDDILDVDGVVDAGIESVKYKGKEGGNHIFDLTIKITGERHSDLAEDIALSNANSDGTGTTSMYRSISIEDRDNVEYSVSTFRNETYVYIKNYEVFEISSLDYVEFIIDLLGTQELEHGNNFYTIQI